MLDQNLDLQIDALTKAGCKKVFHDKVSGSRAERPELAKALEILREGDTLVVWKLDRLGRSVKNLLDLVGGELHQQGVQFKSLTDAIDTGTPSGRFFFHLMASLAEMERKLTIKRTRGGREVARQLGRKGGKNAQKPAPITEDQLLTARRFDDRPNDIWTTLSRVQENMIKGGLQGRSQSGRRTMTRAVTGIDENVKINRALWVLAEEMRKLKA